MTDRIPKEQNTALTKSDHQLIIKACRMATDARNRQIKFEENMSKLIGEQMTDIIAKSVGFAIEQEKKGGGFSGQPAARPHTNDFDGFLPLLGDEDVRVHFRESDTKPLLASKKQQLAVEVGTLIKQIATQNGLEKLEIKYKNHHGE